jgi:dCTP deaminase
MNDQEFVCCFALELVDRSIRFIRHLEWMEEELSRSPVKSNTSDEAGPRHSLKNLSGAIRRIGAIGCEVYRLFSSERSIREQSSAISLIKLQFAYLEELHAQVLGGFIRPSEPIELQRFCRIIKEHVLKNDQLRVYVTDNISEGAYARDPIENVRSRRLPTIEEAASELGCRILDEEGVSPAEQIHVSIPRMDSKNPLRWPSLFHEAAHSVLGDLVDSQEFTRELRKLIPAETFSIIESLDRDLDEWMREIWCDLFAAWVLGPSVLFSQFYSFIGNPLNEASDDKSHPPPGLRLRLIQEFLEHRFPIVKTESLACEMSWCVTMMERLDSESGWTLDQKHALRVFAQVARSYLRDHYFSKLAFEREFSEMIYYTKTLEESSVARMIAELENGLPVASIRSAESFIHERPTSIQEVLLAGGLVRQGWWRGTLAKLIVARRDASSDDEFLRASKSHYDRFEDAVLRSLQLGEWLSLLKKGRSEAQHVSTKERATNGLESTLLVDFEIREFLRSGSLRVMPLVDLDTQLGSTSLDIRLGTSFQVFQPAYRRAAHGPAEIDGPYKSEHIELDYLESIMLLPGQFMLAHSFEYLKLPPTICATLDGRSSYARLGLQIHMTAGILDAGFEGTTTLELLNSGANAIRLFPGVRIAQLRFHRVREPDMPYSQRVGAKYSRSLRHGISRFDFDSDYLRIASAASRGAIGGEHQQTDAAR